MSPPKFADSINRKVSTRYKSPKLSVFRSTQRTESPTQQPFAQTTIDKDLWKPIEDFDLKIGQFATKRLNDFKLIYTKNIQSKRIHINSAQELRKGFDSILTKGNRSTIYTYGDGFALSTNFRPALDLAQSFSQ